VKTEHCCCIHSPERAVAVVTRGGPPEDWVQNPYVQIEGGFLGGLMLGVVPFAGVGQQLLDAAEVLPHGTPQARLGLAVGQIVGGVITTAGGVTGEVLGAAVGVPGIVASTGLVVGGVGNIAAGIQGLSQSLMSTGAGSTGPLAAPAARGGAEAAQQGWKLGAFKSAAKWESQMGKRGWTPQQITEAMQKGERFAAENLVNKSNAATRYVHPETGRSVVIDDITKEVIHVGGDAFKY